MNKIKLICALAFLAVVATFPARSAVVPAISNFSPASGTNGTVLAISGTNFSATASANIVHFGSVTANVLTASPTNLTVKVPAGALYGPISVNVGGLTAYSGKFFQPTYSGIGGGLGANSFAPGFSMPAGNTPGGTAVGDLDGDGKLDLVVINTGDGTVWIYRNISTNGTLSAASFAAPVILSMGGGPDCVTLADLSGSGRLDIVVADKQNNYVSVFQNFCTPGVIATNTFGAPVNFPVGQLPAGVAVLDLNADGLPDIVTANQTDNSISVLENLGSAGVITTHSFATHLDIASGSGADWVAIGDLDGDGRPDIATENIGAGSVSIFRNLCNGGVITAHSFAPRVDLPGAGGGEYLAMGDVTGDGKLDLLATAFSARAFSVFRNISVPGSLTTNSFAPRIDFHPGAWTHRLGLGDFEGDGKLDITATLQSPDQLLVYKNLSTPGVFTNSSLAAPLVLATGSNPNATCVADLAGDGRPDIYFENGFGNSVMIYHNIMPFAGPSAPPVITSQPANLTVVVGNTAVFSVTATGTAPLSYQWYENQTNLLAGATNVMLTLADVQFSQAGSYSVAVSNIAGSTNSLGAVLTVQSTPPPPSCDPVPSGIVAWWPGQGNANDIISGYNGTLVGSVGYANGEVGQCFSFNGSDSVTIADEPALDSTSALTVECWALTYGPSAPPTWSQHLVTKDAGCGPARQYNVTIGDSQIYPGSPDFRISLQVAGNLITLDGATVPRTNTWYHVAMTYDGALLTLYVNGAVDGQTAVSGPITVYPEPVRLGGGGDGECPDYNLNGLLDEPSIYNRALSSNEVAAIYAAGSAGKCYTPTPPIITAQPQSQTNIVGGTANFSVTATGTAPLSYQWYLNQTNLLAGATNATLTLADVQVSQAGSYWVAVSNIAGSTNSLGAVLTVQSPPPPGSCDPMPSGIVAWWPGQGNANDIIGGYNGSPSGSVGYTNGEVGTCFSFNGTDYLVISNEPALNPTNALTIEAWTLTYGHSVPQTWTQEFVTKDPECSGTRQYILEIGDSQVQSGSPDFRTVIWVPSGVVQLDGATVPQTNTWYHVAMTYDGATLKLYVNGVLDGQAAASGPIVVGPEVVRLGGGVPSGCEAYNLNGLLDEPTIYNRALSSSEIAAIYAAGSAGKCFTSTPPVIATQPQSQTNIVGGTANFSVTATGTAPLSYQWYENQSNLLAGATNAMLTLANVQVSQAGSYSVAVSNIAGSTNSLGAVLTVQSPPPPGACDPVPSGIVAWWPGQGNANDIISGYNGTLVGSVGYTNGEVGTCFSFNGSDSVTIPDEPALDSTNALTVECWALTYGPSAPPTWSQHLVTKDAGCGPARQYNVTIGDSQIYPGSPDFRISLQVAGNLITLDGATVPRTNTWYHVAMTYDGAMLTLYVNGAVDGQTAVSGPITVYPEPVRLGGGGDGECPDYNLNGLLDEPSIYNRALSLNEVAAIYAAGSAGKCYTPTLPVITQQPTNQAVVAGGTASFNVIVNGTPPLSYQWSFNGTNLVNATNSTLTLNDIQPANGGVYAVSVTNLSGSAVSSNAILAVLTFPPTITQQPTSQTVVVGNTAVFSVTATGTAPLSYQWYENQSNLLAGATNAMLTLANVQVSQAGSYSVAVSNIAGSTNSLAAVLTVQSPPPPGSCDPVPSGIVAWWPGQGNANDIISGYNGTLVGSVGYTNGEVGTCFSFNGSDSVTIPDEPALDSTNALTVECWALTYGPSAPPTWSQHLVTKDAGCGPARQYNVTIGDSQIYPGSPDFRISLQVAGNLITLDGATVPRTNTWYHVAMTYDGALLTLYVNGAVDGQTAVSGPITVYPEPVRLGGGGDGECPDYNLNGLLDEPSIYNRALSSNEVAAIYAAGSAGKCYTPTPPVITQQPTNQAVVAGGTATFNVIVGGTPPLSYQWSFNGTNLVNATNSTLTLNDVQPANGGVYAVSVTNLSGSAVSSNAALSVLLTLDHFVWAQVSSPQIANQPFGATITAEDQFGNADTNFAGTVSLQASAGTTSGSSGLILNGGFETGTLTNWSQVASSAGQFVINNGTVRPPSEDAAIAPYAGSYCALGEANGPGAYYLYQDVSIPAGVSTATLCWAHCVRNLWSSYSSGQGFQVRICDTNNNVLATAFTTGPSYPLLGSWVQTNYNMTAFAGSKVRVMFWVDSTSYYMDALVDNVSVNLQTASPGFVMTPANTGNFVNGVWNGNITLQQSATNVVLVANDGSGHTGSSNPFSVISSSSGVVTLPPQPRLRTVNSGANLQLTWQISSGTFQVQAADSPQGPWNNVPLPIITNGPNATVTVMATNQQQYFRLVGQ